MMSFLVCTSTVLVLTSSRSFSNISTPNQTSGVIEYTTIATTYYNTTMTSSSQNIMSDDQETLSDKIFAYTMEEPYIYSSISVLSVILICFIICCVICIRRRHSIRSRQMSEAPKPFELALTVTGNSLAPHSKKHSLKIIPALTPDNSNRSRLQTPSPKEYEIEEMDYTQKMVKSTDIRHIDENNKNEQQYNDEVVMEKMNVLEMKNQYASGTPFSLNTLGLSSYEYENEWYDPSLTTDVNVLKQCNYEDEIGITLQKKEIKHNLNKSKILPAIKDDDYHQVMLYQNNTNHSKLRRNDHKNSKLNDNEHDKDDNEDDDDEYQWIISTLKKIAKKDGIKIITIFKENKVTDERLKDLSKSDWKELVPQIGTRNEMRKLYEKAFPPKMTIEGNETD